MRQVTLIHGSWLSVANGLNTVVNYILANQKTFEKAGLNMKRLSYDDLYPRYNNDDNSIKFKYRIRSVVRKYLIVLSRYQAFFAWYLIKRSFIKGAEVVIDKYLATNPDEQEVAFFHSIFPCYYYLKKRTKKQPVVLVIHSNGDNLQQLRLAYPKLVSSRHYRLLEEMSDYVLSKTDRFCLVSKGSKTKFLELYPWVDARKVFFIYNGIALTPPIHKERISSPVYICCVGTVCFRKGQHLLVDALIKMRDCSVPNVHFIIVGGGDDVKKLQLKVQKFNIDKYFSFVGDQRDVASFLNQSDIFVLPSFDEGLPMAIIEAMRASLPIVATNVGGIAEMVEEGVNGLMIKPEVNSICNFLASINNFDWLKMGKNARRTFEEKFSGDKMIASYVKLLTF